MLDQIELDPTYGPLAPITAIHPTQAGRTRPQPLRTLPSETPTPLSAPNAKPSTQNPQPTPHTRSQSRPTTSPRNPPHSPSHRRPLPQNGSPPTHNLSSPKRGSASSLAVVCSPSTPRTVISVPSGAEGSPQSAAEKPATSPCRCLSSPHPPTSESTGPAHIPVIYSSQRWTGQTGF